MSKVSIIILMLMSIPIVSSANLVKIQPGPEIGQDTWCASQNPDGNYGDSQNMEAGVTSHAFLRFTQLDQYIGFEITSAEIDICDWKATGLNRWFCRVLEPWDEDTLTWNNQPAYSNTEYVSHYFPDNWGELHGSTINVTWMVQKWLSGEWENYGWCIKDEGGPIEFCTSNLPDAPSIRPCLWLEGPNLPPLSVQPTSIGKIKSLYSPQQVSSITDGRGQFAKHSKREAWAKINM
jgi:hypothetical protein